MPTLVKVIFIIIFVSATTNLQAKSQALLIGIGQYPGHQKLEGPVNDVALIRKVLLQNEHFRSEHIKELIDEEATRSNILSALGDLQKTTVRGDNVVLYFSGHGTSAWNDNVDADVPSHSGALVPYDIDSVSNKDELNQRLLIGRRDLQPALSKLDDAGVELLVLVDACFSGNVVRGDKDARTLPVRFLDFSKLLQLQLKREETIEESAGLMQEIQYPYQNVFLIAAAQEDQTAHDIPEDKVSQFRTIDSKPHGAFTDSLVQALIGLYKIAEEDKPTITDLHVATRRLMKKKGFLSTPSLLPNDPARTNATTLQSYFGQSVSLGYPSEK